LTHPAVILKAKWKTRRLPSIRELLAVYCEFMPFGLTRSNCTRRDCRTNVTRRVILNYAETQVTCPVESQEFGAASEELAKRPVEETRT